MNMSSTWYRKSDNAEVTAIQVTSLDILPQLQALFKGNSDIVIKKDRWDRSLLSVEIWGDLGLFKYQPLKVGDWLVTEPNYSKVLWPGVYTDKAMRNYFQETPSSKEAPSMANSTHSGSNLPEVYQVPIKFKDADWEALSAFAAPLYKSAGLSFGIAVTYRMSTKHGKQLDRIKIYLPHGGDIILFPGDTLIKHDGHLFTPLRASSSSPISITED